jgi:hypothetical protein
MAGYLSKKLRMGVNTRTGSFDLLRTTGMNSKNHPDDQVGVPVLVGYCVLTRLSSQLLVTHRQVIDGF